MIYQDPYDPCIYFVPDEGAKPVEVVQLNVSIHKLWGTEYTRSAAGRDYAPPRRKLRDVSNMRTVDALPLPMRGKRR